MIHVEIETGERLDGSWGYVIHHYEVGRGYGIVYLGEWGSGGGYASDEEARDGAWRILDGEFGEGGWEHV